MRQTNQTGPSRSTGVILLLIGLTFATIRGGYRIYIEYQYNQTIASSWDLADRASTIAQKAEYINKFVDALRGTNLSGTNSRLWLQTPATSFDENMKALKSLQSRLKDITAMDENSFAYQTAIQQITAQEQGQAHDLLYNLQECWERANYYTFWNPLISLSFGAIQLILIGLGTWEIYRNSDSYSNLF